MEFSPDQQNAIDEINCWHDTFAHGNGRQLTVGGYAGTGKTTIINHLSQDWPAAAVCCPTGKAAQVLRSKGTPASTAHALIYIPKKTPTGRVIFRKKPDLNGTKQIIVDEASMVDCQLYDDLMSFGLPVLFVGDHGQLEPVGPNPELMKAPKLRLEKIHRQAQENPILRLATAFREGRAVPYWSDPAGRLSIRPRKDFVELCRPEVQIICGFNRTRHDVNSRMRQARGVNHELIVPGERLICLRNNSFFGVFNGQQFVVDEIVRSKGKSITLRVFTDDGDPLELPCHRDQFGQSTMEEARRDTCYMDYAYAITCHKAQGSEHNDVLVLEEISTSWDPKRWRYTAATRARERLVYCK